MASITSLGVGSGLDLAGMLDQLREAERDKLVPIAQQRAQQQSKISAYGRLQTGLDKLQDAIGKLNDPKLIESRTSNVSGEGISVTTGDNVNPGRYDVTVSQLARAGSIATNSVASLDTVVAENATTLTLNFGATYDAEGNLDSSAGPLSSYSIDIAAGSTLEDVRDQINADQESGVTASLVNDGTGYRLALNSTETGAEASITGFSGLGGLGADNTTLRAGQDAKLDVNGIAITSTTNRIEGAIQGVTLDLEKTTDEPLTITIGRDNEALSEAIQDFVTAYNELKTTSGNLSKVTGDQETAGALVGDRTLRTIENRLRSDITAGVSEGDIQRLSDMGISLNREGHLEIDESALQEAISADFEGVASFFAGDSEEAGYAGRLDATLSQILDEEGLLQSSIGGAETRIASLEDRYGQMETRIDRNIERYRRQFAQLDSMMLQMNSMSSYLTQQFDALSAMQKS
ncbi:flagellar filament capping protein FliD [Vreelandella olivaria]|uniref:flagellar filament capping protein FliD n=1 Tax=Vreelandella olivaria TaxID=390919 RepID=UPI00201F0B8B|nr:flagellar filament capping protein FliD [Halomonas olivaria]